MYVAEQCVSFGAVLSFVVVVVVVVVNLLRAAGRGGEKMSLRGLLCS